MALPSSSFADVCPGAQVSLSWSWANKQQNNTQRNGMEGLLLMLAVEIYAGAPTAKKIGARWGITQDEQNNRAIRLAIISHHITNTSITVPKKTSSVLPVLYPSEPVAQAHTLPTHKHFPSS
jgi:hypothetical protein